MCKQAQQYSKTHHLSFIRVVSRSTQNPESHWSQVHVTLKVEHFSFHAFYKCGLQGDLMSCLSWLKLQRRYFSCIFPFFEKATNLFNAAGHYACSPTPYQNLHWYPPTSSKNIWSKISIAYFTKWFQSVFTVAVGGGCIFSISPCCPLHTYPQRVVKGPHFEAWTRSEPKVTSPNPARARNLFLKPDLGLKAKLTEGVKICATAE